LLFALVEKPRGRPALLRRSALGNIVSFYKSKTVGSSEAEHRDRGTTRECKHHTNCAESLHIEDMPQISDLSDGPEASVVGKKRLLEGHAPGGPQGKHRKHEERGVNPADASGLAKALAPHPSAAKKPARPLPSASSSSGGAAEEESESERAREPESKSVRKRESERARERERVSE